MSDQLCQSDQLDPARATALSTALGRQQTFGVGDALPPFFHQIYFWDAHPAEALGRDGHPKTGGLIPDMGSSRRMWAGGRLSFERRLSAGVPAEKCSRCEKVVRKTGRSGPLVLVTLRHDIFQSGHRCVTEWQDLVYRAEQELTANSLAAPQAPVDEETAQVVDFNSTKLFRYSALTFNGHRIHYDLHYAKQVEGYAGLVVHGPMLAQLLMLMSEEQLGPLSTFLFRATAPLMHFEQAELCRKGSRFWLRGPDGRQCMTAEANVRLE